jgi:hypothetical protein
MYTLLHILLGILYTPETFSTKSSFAGLCMWEMFLAGLWNAFMLNFRSNQLTCGRAIAQAARFEPRSGHVGFVVDSVALGQVFSEYFGFPCQFSFHQLLLIHDLSSGAGTIGQLVADVPSGLSFTRPQETKKRKRNRLILCDVDHWEGKEVTSVGLSPKCRFSPFKHSVSHIVLARLMSVMTTACFVMGVGRGLCRWVS